MENPTHQSISVKNIFLIAVIALGFLFGFGWGLYHFIAAVVDKLNSVQSDLSKALITASATVLAAVVALVLGKIWEQRLKIRDEIRAKKIPIYEKHVATFFKILFGQKLSGKHPNQKEMVAAFAAFSEHAIIWGSVDVIRAWVRYRCLDHAKTPPQEQLAALERLFLAIRKDVGSEVRRLEKGELFRLFVNDDRETSPTTTDEKVLP